MLVYPQVLGRTDARPRIIRPDFIERVATAYDPQILSRFPTPDFISRTPNTYEPGLSFLLRIAPDFASRTPTAYDPTITSVTLYNSTHSLECNSTADGASFGDLTEWDGINKFTRSFWMRPTALTASTFSHLCGKVNGSVYLGRSSPSVPINDLSFTNGSSVRTTDSPISSINTWYHIFEVYDGTIAPGVGSIDRWKVWVNGSARARSGTSPGATIGANASTFNIGGTIAASTTIYFDEVAVWLGVAATATQATEIYNSGHIWDLATSTLGQPTHFYHLDNNYNDAGSNPNTGSALSTPVFNNTIVAPP
jgi:hypothetical protein